MFISLGYFSKKMLIPLLIPLIYIIRHTLSKKLEEEEKKSIFINTFIVSISYNFNIILLIIENSSIKPKKKKTLLKVFKNQLLIEKKKIERKRTFKTFIFLFIISLCNFLNFQIYDIVKIFKPNDYNQQYFYSISITFFFLSTALMSYLLFGKKIYKHQKLSMIMSSVLSIIMFSILFQDFSLHLIYLLICLLIINFRYILMIFGKLFMEKYYISKIKILSFFGIFGSMFSLIINIFAHFLKFENLKEKIEIDNNKILSVFIVWSKIDKIYFFGVMISWFFENYLCWFCISEFSPNHYIIYRNISSILIILKEFLHNINIYKNYVIIIFFIAIIGIFICGLIFNEIIILKFCKFDKYTAIELDRRQKEEIKNTLKKSFENDTDTIIIFDESENSL